jgi:hypothetical protein
MIKFLGIKESNIMLYFIKCVLILTGLATLSVAQEVDGFTEDVPAPVSTPRPERFAPRIIAMHPHVLFFEEGSGFEVDITLARDAVDKAYLYIEDYFSADNDDDHARQNRNLILQTILAERSASVAQVFARRTVAGRDYLFINIFPARSIANQSRLMREFWRPTVATSPAFWRIRYDITGENFWGLSYDLRQ